MSEQSLSIENIKNLLKKVAVPLTLGVVFSTGAIYSLNENRDFIEQKINGVLTPETFFKERILIETHYQTMINNAEKLPLLNKVLPDNTNLDFYFHALGKSYPQSAIEKFSENIGDKNLNYLIDVRNPALNDYLLIEQAKKQAIAFQEELSYQEINYPNQQRTLLMSDAARSAMFNHNDTMKIFHDIYGEETYKNFSIPFQIAKEKFDDANWPANEKSLTVPGLYAISLYQRAGGLSVHEETADKLLKILLPRYAYEEVKAEIDSATFEQINAWTQANNGYLGEEAQKIAQQILEKSFAEKSFYFDARPNVLGQLIEQQLIPHIQSISNLSISEVENNYSQTEENLMNCLEAKEHESECSPFEERRRRLGMQIEEIATAKEILNKGGNVIYRRG